MRTTKPKLDDTTKSVTPEPENTKTSSSSTTATACS